MLYKTQERKNTVEGERRKEINISKKVGNGRKTHGKRNRKGKILSRVNN